MRTIRPPSFPSRQRGAVLYVALMMLILLALIGIIGAQVSSMQERMSANYLASNMAFQNAETRARTEEKCVESAINRVGTCASNIDQYCDSPSEPDAVSWAAQRKMTDKDKLSRIRSIGKCIAGGMGLGMGKKPESEEANPVFQITAYSADRDTDPSSSAAVDTIFRP
jgi:type IV pilus assembly protein PilX